MSKIVIVGAGAAGMMAAYQASKNPENQIILLEKNNRLGKKIVITGKGRCNVTNCSTEEELISHIITNPKFMYSAFHQFNSFDMMNFLEDNGCPIKVERGNRVFPVSDSSFDIVDVFKRVLHKKNIRIILDSEVTLVEQSPDNKFLVKTKKDVFENIDSLVLATGGRSYEATGSTGDGFKWLKTLGHKINPLYPSLVGFKTKEEWPKSLMGLTLKNIELSIYDFKNNKLFFERGDILFTHKGFSGPLVLKASAHLTQILAKNSLQTYIDLKPAIEKEQLHQKFEKIFASHPKQSFDKTLSDLMPKSLAETILKLNPSIKEKRNCDIIKTERETIIHWIKNIPLEITSTCGFNEAVITQGGVKVSEVNPQRMESKIVPNLFVVGELLDVDAYTGGYNLQIAWSSGFVAGKYLSM